METHFCNIKEDRIAFYDYFLRVIPKGKLYANNLYKTKLVAMIGISLFMSLISYIVIESLVLGLVFFGLFTFFEIINLFASKFEPRYTDALKTIIKQGNSWTQKEETLFLIPKTISFDEEWLRLSSSEAKHEWRLAIIDHIGWTKNFIFIHVSNFFQIIISRREFSTEKEYVDFGNQIIDFWKRSQIQN